MIEKWFLLLCLFSLTMGTFWPNQSFATKPAISLEQCVEKADIIVVAKIKSKEVLEEPRKDSAGNWLPLRQRIFASIQDVLKNNLKKEIQKDIRFDCGPLTFEEDKTFVLFLTNKNAESAEFDFIAPPAIRIEATSDAIKKIKEIVTK